MIKVEVGYCDICFDTECENQEACDAERKAQWQEAEEEQ